MTKRKMTGIKNVVNVFKRDPKGSYSGWEYLGKAYCDTGGNVPLPIAQEDAAVSIYLGFNKKFPTELVFEQDKT